MIFLFWLSFIFILYTYLGYPALIGLVSAFKRDNPDPEEPLEWPSVTIIIPVHNEEKYVLSKIENLRKIDYPKEKLKISFSSDGSQDATDEIISQHSDVELISYSPRKGKPSAINACAPAQESEILVFSDARQSIDPMAIKKLVARLLQPGVGAVSGELVQLDSETKEGESIGLYWKYEKWIRTAESSVHSVAGVTGALYAIYRKDFVPIPSDALLDDFEVPIKLLEKGKRILIERGACVYDITQENASLEKKRKIRTLMGNYQSFSRNRWLFSIRKNPIWWQFISHKVFRLLVPYALISLFFTSLFMSGWIYNITAVTQILFYCLALIGRFATQLRSVRLVSFSHVFLELNLAAVQALFQFLRTPIDAKWEKTS